VRKAVNGLAEYLLIHCVNVKDRGVVVAYDSRYMSQEFALETAKVLGAHGIKTYVFESLRPTPLLSYAVRYLSTAAGIMITASHNPPEYNGFKVYNEDGGQFTPDEAGHIIDLIEQTENELTIPVLEKERLEEKGLLEWIGNEIDHAYLEQLKQMSQMDTETLQEEKDLQIVFTPLHGTASKLVRSEERRAGKECNKWSVWWRRRRHTKSKRDWSSDVCSSDLHSGPGKRKIGRKRLARVDR